MFPHSHAGNRGSIPLGATTTTSNKVYKLGETVCQTPEQFKAWSQNLGHEKVLTTFYSYGEVGNQRQGEIIRDLGSPQTTITPEMTQLAKALVQEIRQSGN